MLKQEMKRDFGNVVEGIKELRRYAKSSKFHKDQNMHAGDVILRCNEILDIASDFECEELCEYLIQ